MDFSGMIQTYKKKTKKAKKVEDDAEYILIIEHPQDRFTTTEAYRYSTLEKAKESAEELTEKEETWIYDEEEEYWYPKGYQKGHSDDLVFTILKRYLDKD